MAFPDLPSKMHKYASKFSDFFALHITVAFFEAMSSDGGSLLVSAILLLVCFFSEGGEVRGKADALACYFYSLLLIAKPNYLCRSLTQLLNNHRIYAKKRALRCEMHALCPFFVFIILDG